METIRIATLEQDMTGFDKPYLKHQTKNGVELYQNQGGGKFKKVDEKDILGTANKKDYRKPTKC